MYVYACVSAWFLNRAALGSKRPLGGGRGLLSNPQKEIDEMLPINLLPPHNRLKKHSSSNSNYTGFLTDVEMRLELANRCSCSSRGCDDYALCPFRSLYPTTGQPTCQQQQQQQHAANCAVPMVYTDLSRYRLSHAPLSEEDRPVDHPPSVSSPEISDSRCSCPVTGDGVDLLRPNGSVAEVTNLGGTVVTIEANRTKRSSSETS